MGSLLTWGGRGRERASESAPRQIRAKNKALGLAGQAEILIGHLYNLIQSWSNFWVAMVENCTQNGQWPAAILSSVAGLSTLVMLLATASQGYEFPSTVIH